MKHRGRQDLLDELTREKAGLVDLDAQRDRARQRITELQAEISAASVPVAPKSPVASLPVAQETVARRTSSEKVRLFRELFRGRMDVFPKRWVNTKKDTKGYAPACANEWVRGVCDKPRVKCGECPNQAFIPVTDKVVLEHFQGRHVAGVYPLLEDDTCWFLSVDFDKGQWQQDVSAFVETCHNLGVPIAVERSRSGNGAHAWFFFNAPVAAGAARKLGCYLITETMTRRHELPMSSYDRLFPNQDTMPRGGFGNLIALPFQDGPRRQGNTLFVDESWNPHADQWAYLASVRRLQPDEVDLLAREASQKGQVIGVRMGEPAEDDEISAPWMRSPSRRERPIITEPLPACVHAVLAQLLFVEKTELSSQLLNQMKRLAAFQNPEFYKKQAMRLSTALTPRVISCAEDLPQHVALPRGCTGDVKELLADCGVELEVDDKRTDGDPLDIRFHGELTSVQEKAVRALLDHDIGVFVAPPGSGKTVVGAHLVAQRGRSTLILVHRTQLLEQWIAQLSLFLDLKPKEIGQIGGGKNKPNGSLDVAMIQSLVRRDEIDETVAGYGHVIVDECHHVPAVSFERVMREVKARYLTGLTATPRRRDGHHPILQLQLGPVRFAIDPKSQAARQSFEHRLIVRETGFKLDSAVTNPGIQEIYGQLASNETRNRFILDDVVRALEEGRSPLLLTERRDHVEYFAEHLGSLARNLIVLQGGMRSKARRAAIEQLASIPDSEERLVLATGRFIGEGFDDARLDTLFLAMPISWQGTLVQYAGRLHRKHHAKMEVRILDYVDRDVPMLARMFDKRMRGYRAMGYVVGEHGASRGVDDDAYVIEYDEEVLRSLDNDFP
ncbi:MAG: DEAD/DEAH box helicase family protein [bacterium]|nr:DEAD/DEAH box helicase family protein [bacterium]